MTRAQRLLPAAIGLGALFLAIGYALAGLRTATLLIAITACLWWVALWRDWGWAASLGLILTTGAAAAGIWLGVGSEWMIGGLVAALTAWDLDHWMRTMRSVEQVQDARALERQHLGRLLLVDGLAVALAILALRLRVRFSFGMIVLLVLLLIGALSGVIRAVRHENPRPLP